MFHRYNCISTKKLRRSNPFDSSPGKYALVLLRPALVKGRIVCKLEPEDVRRQELPVRCYATVSGHVLHQPKSVLLGTHLCGPEDKI